MRLTDRGRLVPATLTDERGHRVISGYTDKGYVTTEYTVTPMTWYLDMDGVNDYIKCPTVTFDEVVMDMEVDHDGTGRFYFDSRSGGTSYFYRETTIEERWAGLITGIYVDGVLKSAWGNHVPDLQMTTVRVVMSGAQTDNVNIFSNSSNTQNQKGKLYNVKFYNASVLVAHYDMTKGNISDQSGNGNHANQYGGTWVGTPSGGTTGSSSYATKQVINQTSSVQYATKQVINSTSSVAYATKQVINQTSSAAYATKQSLYAVGSIVYATQQVITAGGVVGSIAYATKQILTQVGSVSYATKQTVYGVSSSSYATKQSMYIIGSAVFATLQNIVDANSAIVRRISIGGSGADVIPRSAISGGKKSIAIQGTPNPPTKRATIGGEI